MGVGEQLTARVRLGDPNAFLATTPGIEYRETFRIRTGAHGDILGSKSHYPARDYSSVFQTFLR